MYCWHTERLIMKRINISITQKLYDTLKQIKETEGISASEVIRRALDQYIKLTQN